MQILDAKWTPTVNILEIACDCGWVILHRADRWKVRCEKCGAVGHKAQIIEEELRSYGVADSAPVS